MATWRNFSQKYSNYRESFIFVTHYQHTRMINLLGKIAWNCQNIVQRLISKYQRQLFFQNKKSSIHPTFRLGLNNVLDLSPDSFFSFAEEVSLQHHNFITTRPGAHFKIGKETYITRATISCLGEIEIGEHCILGEGMKIFDHNHQYSKSPFKVSKTAFNIGKIKIGNNVWTGANVTILKDVTIGDNVIIGAGVLVYKDIPADTVVRLKQELTSIDIKH